MPSLVTVRRAQEEIRRLQHYVDIAGIMKLIIIKEYAYPNSIEEITRILNRGGYKLNEETTGKEYVTAIIKGKVSDELSPKVKVGVS